MSRTSGPREIAISWNLYRFAASSKYEDEAFFRSMPTPTEALEQFVP
jgi:hypothetical protein